MLTLSDASLGYRLCWFNLLSVNWLLIAGFTESWSQVWLVFCLWDMVLLFKIFTNRLALMSSGSLAFRFALLHMLSSFVWRRANLTSITALSILLLNFELLFILLVHVLIILTCMYHVRQLLGLNLLRLFNQMTIIPWTLIDLDSDVLCLNHSWPRNTFLFFQ